jgi:NitT/TauT family transport system substrate-binding protein
MDNPIKGITIQRSGRLIALLFAVACVYTAARSCGWMRGTGMEPVPSITDSMGSGERGGNTLHVALHPGALFLPGIVENGGLTPGRDSRFRLSHGVEVKFSIEEDQDRCAGGLISGRYDVIWASLDSTVLRYPAMSSVNPVVFLHCGWSAGADAVAVDSRITGPSGFKGRTITCVENSPWHFTALYLLSISGVKPGDVSWKFALTPADAAYLFSEKKADICLADAKSLRRAVGRRAGARILLSTRDAARLVPFVFITRESCMMLRRELLLKFAAGWFEGTEALRLNPVQAAGPVSGLFRIRGEELQEELAGVRPAAYTDNLSFFEISGESLSGYGHMFDTASSLWIGQGKLRSAVPSGILRATDVVLALGGRNKGAEARAAKEPAYPRVPGAGVRYVSGVFSLYFGKNSAAPDFSSRARLKKIAGIASVLATPGILLRASEDPAEDKWMNLPAQRTQEAARILINEYRIPPERIIVAGGGFPNPAEKPEHARRVDLIFASPDRQ